MCPQRRITTFTASALGLALGASVLVSPAPARAADDTPADSKFLRSILEGIGLRKDGEGINYQERAPLVIPSTRALPPPEKSEAAIANDPAWPKDPDVERQKAEAAQERRTRRSAGDEAEHAQSVMRQEDLTPGPKPRNARKAASAGTSSSDHEYGEVLSPSQLGTKRGFFSNIFGGSESEVAKFTGEPPRASLTEPPPGYQTPSPDQPYGVGKEKPVAPKAGDYQRNHATEGQ
jgi:hypothetical protein